MRRITERQVAEGDAAAAAVAIAQEHHGSLEGVEVDFRHPLLIAGEWEALPWWYVWGETPRNAGIIFSSEAKTRIVDLRAEKGMPADIPAVYAMRGDRISVESVEIVETNAFYDHAHDKQIRLAQLRIEHPTGEVLHPPGPLAFYGVGRIQKHGTREAFDHIIERVLSHADVDGFPPRSIDDAFTDAWEKPPDELALLIAERAHRSFFNLVDDLPHDALSRSHLRSVANNAALAGFLLAKLEVRGPLETMGKIAENARLTAEGRKNTKLREIARDLADKHPHWSRNRIAAEVLKDFPDKEQSAVNRILRTDRIGPDPA